MTNNVSAGLMSTELEGRDKSKQESLSLFKNTNLTCLAFYFAFEYETAKFIW